MIRAKLIGLVILLVAALSVVVASLTGKVASDIEVQTEERLKSGAEVIRLANRIDDYSLVVTADSIASDADIVFGMGCPGTPEGLAELNREQTPQLDAEGQPVRDALGRPLDTQGRPIAERGSRRCQATAHVSALQRLRAWAASREETWSANAPRFLSDRDTGAALSRQPDLLIAADGNGEVIARLGFDMDDWFGPSRPRMNAFPVVGRTEQFGPQHDMIAWRETDSDNPRPAQVAAAPVFVTGADGQRQFLGTILVGYFLVDESAEEDVQPLVGIDTAYFIGGASGVTLGGTSMSNRPDFLAALQSGQFFERSADGASSEPRDFAYLTGEGQYSVYEFAFEGQRYLVSLTPFSGARADATTVAGFLTVTSVTEAVKPLVRYRLYVPMAAALFILIGVAGVLVVVKETMKPIEDISKGIQEVIAGNKEYMWPVDEKSWLSDMAHSLNIMSARLQGKRDPDSEDTEGASEWAAMTGGERAGGGEGGEAPKRPAGVAGLGGLRGRQAQQQSGGDPGQGGGTPS